ncbi:BZ3500_MvSof-1268-A1-R1_Chr1-3g01947 [Microbotryum saponariae]|uniref:BZ3500_MvSof-1268-A1-R1_Chr1-3g01947 protein n=1 Tax=Microbotryum saponariae TaxID=289078 RepID=A0A2X0M8M8_9BASI|nr:BZ3500_MvSof-1268-A1-R1_Chr1-3g01947 [Microbotryum saponariae]SCZ94976.1 BZ3501_MvSof-1269-A2-R1_Chr1-3g01549 [Microbotryum saponariae]
MSSSKGSMYSITLDQARRLALWTEAHPAHSSGKVNSPAESGSGSSSDKGMDWKELLRKFTKHNPQRPSEYAMSLLARPASVVASTGNVNRTNVIVIVTPVVPPRMAAAGRDAWRHAPSSKWGPLGGGLFFRWANLIGFFIGYNIRTNRASFDVGDCFSRPACAGETDFFSPITAATAQTDQLLHSLLARAAAASSYSPSTSHALDNPGQAPAWPPLVRIDDRPDILASLAALEAALRQSQGKDVERNSAAIVSAYGLYSVGEFDRAANELKQVDKGLPSAGDFEAYDLTLRVLANATEGFALERLGKDDEAIAAYTRAAKIYEDACAVLSARNSPMDDVELHGVGEAALYRLCVHSKAKSFTRSDPRVAYAHHRLYVRRATTISAAQKNPSRRAPSTELFPGSKALVIQRGFRHLMKQTGQYEAPSSGSSQEANLRSSTSLPKAGEVNKPYLMFLDEVAEGWRRNGAGRDGAAEVVEVSRDTRICYYWDTLITQADTCISSQVMYNALTHTFQSHRLLRHLARALVALGQYDEAGKAVRLYFELWNKARETDAVQVAKDIRRLRGESAPRLEHDDDREDRYANDFDTDRDFVETAAWGSRLFCKYINDPKFGLELAKRAKEIFDEKKDRQLAEDKVVLSKMERACGVALGALTAKEADVESRPHQHAEALKHLETAVQLNPNSWETLYHLAYQLAELRQIDPALDRARQAAALNNSSKEVWHLLGLLVAAQKDLGAALQVIETSLDDDDEDEADEAGVNGVRNGQPKFNSIENGLDRFEFSSDDTQRLQVEFSMRMTRNVVIEAMEGPEAALIDQQQLLADFSKSFAQVRDAPELKIVADALPIDTSNGAPLARRKSISLGRARSIRGSVTGNDEADFVAAPAPSVSMNPRATKVLVDIWLMSAASYRRAHKLEDSRGAIAEAEALNPNDADVWTQLALYRLAKNELKAARSCLIKALSFQADHVPAVILMARVYLADPVPSSTTTTSTPTATTNPKLPFAEALLDTLTKRYGWDVPEAWFELSKCYKGSGRTEREKECLVWALQLEETRSIRSLSAIPRLL